MEWVEIGDARLYCGDCRDVLSEVEADAVVTDPPWMDYETGRYDASEWHCPVGYVEPSEYLPLVYQVMNDASAAILWCRWDCFELHAEAMRQAKFDVRNCIVWPNPNHTAGDLEGNLGNQHEMAVFAVKGNWKRHGKRETNVWMENHLFSRTHRYHPTQKPLGLMFRSVKLACPPNGIVLDPFMGSGTTGVVAAKLGRSFVGIEKEPKYFDIACKRVEDAVNSEPLFAQGA